MMHRSKTAVGKTKPSFRGFTGVMVSLVLVAAVAFVPLADAYLGPPAVHPGSMNFVAGGNSQGLVGSVCSTLHHSSALGLKMGESFYETSIAAKGLMRRHAATNIYSRMAQRMRSKLSGLSEETESTGEATVDSSTAATQEAAAMDPMNRLERQMKSLDPEGKVLNKKSREGPSSEGGSAQLRHRNDYRKEGDWSKKKGDAGDSKVDVAFTAFANSLLRTGQGKVRSLTIWSAFRDEFPSLAEDTKVSNQTLWRKLAAWYMQTTGEPLAKAAGGSYSCLSILNPRFTSVDLTSLRAAQALFEPNMKRKFERLGMEVGVLKDTRPAGSTGQTSYEERQQARKDRSKQEQRVEVQLNSNGKVIRVVRRADAANGIKAKVLSGKPLEEPTTRVQDLKKVAPTVKMCAESFCNSLLTRKPGTLDITFGDVKASFLTQFPLLANSDRLTDSYLGRVVGEWYSAKYNLTLVRQKTVEMAQRNLTRAEIPYTDLAMRSVGDADVDMQLLNEAKVALRRALQMEGVGILVKREGAGKDYKVALIAEGSPAAVEGSMRVGDSLISINSKSTSEMDVQQLADAVLGRRGTRVKLTLGRIGEFGGLHTYSATLTRSDKSSMTLTRKALGDEAQK